MSWDPADHCLGFFAQFWTTKRVQFPNGACVLEIGCAEADWLTPMKALRPDLHLTGVDQRDHTKRPGADRLIKGDVLTANIFEPGQFDAIVSVSTIEHVGLGEYGDALNPDGDTVAMAHMKAWLKPGGVVYLDVPYRPDGPPRLTEPNFRAYDEPSLQSRILAGWTEVDREVFNPGHPDGPYIALVLKP